MRTKVNTQIDGYMQTVEAMRDFLHQLPKRSWDASFDDNRNVTYPQYICYLIKFKHEQDAIAFKLMFGYDDRSEM